jgi:hypothetical protein
LNDDGEVKLTDKYKLAEAWGSPMLVAGLSVIGIVVWMLIAKSMK